MEEKRPLTMKDLEKAIVKLTQCIAKMAHFTGQQRILDEFGIKRWDIEAKDMKKYKD